MLSIIVSTYQPEKFQLFLNSLKETIGDIRYEVIKIENPGKMGICEAYNKGVAQAQYPFICFSHDDILFRTQNWGSIIIETFQKDERLGLVGIAGSIYKCWVPSGWASSQTSDLIKLNLIQTYKGGRSIEHISVNMTKSLEPVKAVDGCWFCTTKDITNEFSFDEELLTNYHCYDVDYSLQIGSKYKVMIIQDILIEHCSDGNFSQDWLTETYKLHGKWQKQLPQNVEYLPKEQQQKQEVLAYSFLLDKTLEFKIAYSKILGVLFSSKLLKLVGFSKWMLLSRWTFSGMIKGLVK